jgi:hypothetical protein
MTAAGPLCCLPAAQVYQLRWRISEWLRFVQSQGTEVGASFPGKPSNAIRGKPLTYKCINKRADMLSRFFRHSFVKAAHLIKKLTYGVLPIKELPDAHAGRVQTKASKTKRGIGVEKHGPIVKLLPEHDPGVGYGCLIAFQGMSLRSPITIDLNRTTPLCGCTSVWCNLYASEARVLLAR